MVYMDIECVLLAAIFQSQVSEYILPGWDIKLNLGSNQFYIEGPR